MFFKKGKRKIICIEGMSCEGCAKRIEVGLENLTDISKVKVNLEKKQVIVTYENTLDDCLLQNTIEELGYTVVGIKEDA